MTGGAAIDLNRLRFVPANAGDAERLAEMSLAIWRRHYFPEILSLAAIEHLWQRSYRPQALREQMFAGSVFRWIEHDETALGFLAYRHEPEADRLWLSKLYVLPEYHGRGIGGCALAEVRRAAVALGVREIRLYVFKRNERAICAYRRAGYEIAGEDYADAGGGFHYDDYVMSLTLRAVADDPAHAAAHGNSRR